ncbi:hypothetical protein [Deinococcus sp.]|uniref:hypothetical protein n=1 Tax=Deinococcus sp. TaxID=47478 RepID=UPI0025F19D49|nr:hypothetical protein [Deinococcus sp.]
MTNRASWRVLGGALLVGLGTLSACTALPGDSPFTTGQIWLLEVPASASTGAAFRLEVPTNSFYGYPQASDTLLGEAARPTAGQASGDDKIYANMNPLLLSRVMSLPGKEAALLYAPADRAAQFVWYGGAAGEPYVCRLNLPTSGKLKVLSGQLSRLVQGVSTSLGECSATLQATLQATPKR